MFRFSGDDSPYITEFIVQEGAAGITEEAALLVFNGIENAMVHPHDAPLLIMCQFDAWEALKRVDVTGAEINAENLSHRSRVEAPRGRVSLS